MDSFSGLVGETDTHKVVDLWFEDATLVIHAGDCLFKVFRSILVAKSPVFQDMLSLPQPADSQLIEGCPVVHLPDSASDATYFLKALFHYEFFESYPAEVAFPIIAGVLRLTKKYQVDPLRNRALHHLSERYPMSQDQWDRDESWNFNPFGAVELAREISADWILPMAFYRCCGELSLAEFVTLDVLSSDIQIYAQAIDTLHSWNSRVLNFLLDPVTIPDCVSPHQCLERRMKLRGRWGGVFDDYLPLGVWSPEDWDELAVCMACLPKLKQTHAASIERLWAALPSIFGLPDWNTLETMKLAAFN
ncbi:hypothetical protein C8J57DRAFT_1346569 [Mycena rebaudengoi]|nr:hypothetical protein C8J57DRAFT_1346569 [Mycena rebaudengoi]